MSQVKFKIVTTVNSFGCQ